MDLALTRVRWIPLVASVAAILFGIGVLESYVFGIEPLLPFHPFLPPSQPLVALMLLLVGTSLLALRLGHRRLQLGAAGATVVLAGTVMLEYLLGLRLGVDTVLFGEAVRQMSRVFPGRPAPITGATFLLLGGLLLPIGRRPDGRASRSRTVAALFALVLPVIAIGGHLFGVSELYALSPKVATSLHVALMLLVLAAGTALATDEGAAVELLTSREPGTVVFRRVLPITVLLPLLFAVGSVHALRSGLYQIHLGLTLFVAVFIGLSLAAAFWAVGLVRQADSKRRLADRAQSELALRERLLAAETAVTMTVRDERAPDPAAPRRAQPRARSSPAASMAGSGSGAPARSGSTDIPRSSRSAPGATSSSAPTTRSRRGKRRRPSSIPANGEPRSPGSRATAPPSGSPRTGSSIATQRAAPTPSSRWIAT